MMIRKKNNLLCKKTTPVQVFDGTGVLCVKLYTYSLLCVAAEQAVFRFKAVKLYDRYFLQAFDKISVYVDIILHYHECVGVYQMHIAHQL